MADDRPWVDAVRQRQLHQDAIDLLVGVEPGNEIEDGRGGAVRRQAMLERGDPGGGAGPRLAADIDLAGGVVADQHRGEPGRYAMRLSKRRHRGAYPLAQRAGDGRAVDQRGFRDRRTRAHGYFVASCR